MLKTKLIIAEDHAEYVELLTDFFATQEDFQIVGVAKDGLDAVELIAETNPDIVILDMIMPRLDGIGVLERLSCMELVKKPKVIILSAIESTQTIQEALKLGASYYLIKPFDMEPLVQRIRRLQSTNTLVTSNESPKFNAAALPPPTELSENATLKYAVSTMMQNIGVPAHIKGYGYLKDSIAKVYQDAGLLDAVTKELYPDVAKENNTKASRVERAIRHAIDKAWENGPNEAMSKIFINRTGPENKPTNSEFIATIAEWLKLKKQSEESMINF